MKILPDQRIIEALQCPICNHPMQIIAQGTGLSLHCRGARRHCYDIASSGYVNLMPPGHTDGGDSKQAVRARTEFLNLELYRPVADCLVDMICQHGSASESLLVDAGCGEGYYTSILADKGISVAGVDLSRPGAEATAKRLARQGISHAFVGVASVFSLPFAEASVDIVTNIFAPCAEEEFIRVLRPKGILAVVYAGPDHLMGLKEILYDQTKTNDGRADLPCRMTLLEKRRVRFDITVSGGTNLQNLFAMTPYYWRTSLADREKLKDVEQITTPVDMMVAIYQKTSIHKEES